MFRALVREIEDLSWAPQPTAVLEMAVIRLATMPSGDDVSQLLTRLDQLERRLASSRGIAHAFTVAALVVATSEAGRVSDRSPKRRSPESSGARAPSSPPASTQSAESEIDPFDRPPGGPNPSTPQATGQPKSRTTCPCRSSAKLNGRVATRGCSGWLREQRNARRDDASREGPGRKSCAKRSGCGI